MESNCRCGLVPDFYSGRRETLKKKMAGMCGVSYDCLIVHLGWVQTSAGGELTANHFFCTPYNTLAFGVESCRAEIERNVRCDYWFYCVFCGSLIFFSCHRQCRRCRTFLVNVLAFLSHLRSNGDDVFVLLTIERFISIGHILLKSGFIYFIYFCIFSSKIHTVPPFWTSW